MSTTHHDFVVKHGLSLADDKNIKLGSSDEFKLYHTSSGNSIISETGAGSLYIDGTNIYLRNGTSTGEAMADFLSDGAVNLYYNNSPKLATTSSGVTVTGGIAATTSISLNGSTMAFDSGNDYMEFNKAVFSPIGYFVGTTGTKVGHLQNSSGVMLMEASTTRQISFGNETNGEFVRIDATGNVGIGTSAPNAALDISQSNTRGAYLRSSTTGSRMHFLDATTASVTTVGVGAEGNNMVLIGGGSEILRLNSSGSSTFSGNVTMQDDDALLFIKETDGTNIAAVGDLTGAGQGGAFYYNHGGTATIQLKSYEASTIGHGLNVGGNVTAATNGSVYAQYFGNSTDTNTLIQFAGSDDIRMRTGGTERLRITDASTRIHNSLMVGSTAAPEGQLTLQNDDASLRIRSNTTTTKGLTLRYNHAGNFGQLLVDHQGNNQLDMKYYALSHTFGRSDSQQFMTINSSGNATFSNTLEVNNYRYFDGDYNVTYYRKANHTTLGYQLHRDNGISYYEWNTGGNHSHDFQFVSNNSKILNLATNGNVNIPNGGLMVGATTAPSDKLEIRGNVKVEQTSNTDAIIKLNPNSATIGSNNRWELVGTNSAGNYGFQIREGTTPYLTINNGAAGNGGNVGIGTSAPGRKLHLKDGQIKFQNTSSGGWAGLDFSMGNGTYDGYMGMLDSNGSFFIDVDSNGNDLVILQNGNVGIGTSAPATKLHVSAGSTNANTIVRLQQGTTSGNYSGIELGRTDGSGNVQTTTAIFGGVPISGIAGVVMGSINTALPAVAIQSANSSNGHIVFNPKGQEKVRITADGKVGIGKTNPLQPLNVHGRISSNLATADHYYGAWLDGNSTSGQDNFLGLGPWHNNAGYVKFIQSGTPHRLSIYTTDTSDHVTLQESGGNVGIGTSSPVAKIHLKGSGTYNHTPANPQGADFVITSSEMGDNNAHSIMQLVSVRQSLTTGSGSTGYLGFSTIDDSNNVGINDAARIAIVNETGSSVTSPTSLSFWTNVGTNGSTGVATERMRINSSGNVGIGNSIASSFHAGANNLVIGSGSGSEGMTIYGGGESNIFFADGTAGSAAYVGRIEYSHSVDKMLFYVNNSNAMTLASGGAAQFGFAGAALQQADSQALSIITPASGGGQGIAFKRLDSNNDQGLGEISWSNNTQDGQANIRVKTEGAVNSTDMHFDVNKAGTLVTALSIDGSAGGKVGIGTSAPQGMLHVAESKGSGGDLWVQIGAGNAPSIHIQNTANAANTNAALYFRNSSAEKASIGARFVNQSTGETELRFGTTNSSGTSYERMTLDGDGKLGIGTTNPSYLVHADAIVSTDPSYIVAGSGSNFVMAMGSQNRPGVAQEAFIGTLSNERFKVKVNNVEKATFTSTGLGIGQTAPTSLLEVKGANGAAGIRLTSPSGLGSALNITGSGYGEFYLYQAGGNPKVGLQANGTSYFLGGGITVGHSVIAGISGNPADLNYAEVGPGYIRVNRDDTADAAQLSFGKNGAVHSYLETRTNGLGFVTNVGNFAFEGGNVGIGQTSFGTNGTLQVNGGIGLTGTSVIRLQSNADDSNSLKFFGNQFVAGQNNSHSYSYSGGGLLASISPSGGRITLDAGSVNTSGHRLKVINGGNGIDGSLQYLSGTTSRFHVDSASGDVGIGTSPVNNYKLEVYDGDYTQMMLRAPTYPVLRFKADNQNSGNNGTISIGANNVFQFNPNNSTNGISIANNGDVGIGIAAPTAKFHVADGSLMVAPNSNNSHAGAYHIIGSVANYSTANGRYIHAQLNTPLNLMFHIIMEGYTYTAGQRNGRCSGYVYNYATGGNGATGSFGGPGVYDGRVSGNIVAMHSNQNNANIEIVIDTGSTGTTNRWGSYSLVGGNDHITSYSGVEVIQYTTSSTGTRQFTS